MKLKYILRNFITNISRNFAKLLGEMSQNTFWRNYSYKNAAKY
jgi:hypothetical protein